MVDLELQHVVARLPQRRGHPARSAQTHLTLDRGAPGGDRDPRAGHDDFGPLPRIASRLD